MLDRQETHKHAMRIASEVERCIVEWDGECDPPRITRIGFEEWLTDYLAALCPSDEDLGRAAVKAVIPAIGYHGEGLTRLDKNYADIGRAIREELCHDQAR